MSAPGQETCLGGLLGWRRKEEGEDEDGRMMGRCAILPSEHSSVFLTSSPQAAMCQPELLQQVVWEAEQRTDGWNRLRGELAGDKETKEAWLQTS